MASVRQSAPHTRGITISTPHHSIYTGWMLTNSVKALKARTIDEIFTKWLHTTTTSTTTPWNALLNSRRSIQVYLTDKNSITKMSVYKCEQQTYLVPFNLWAAILSDNASDHAKMTGGIAEILPLKCLMFGLGSPRDSLIDIQQAVSGSAGHYDLPAQWPRHLDYR